jgi:hypothetical protein
MKLLKQLFSGNLSKKQKIGVRIGVVLIVGLVFLSQNLNQSIFDDLNIFKSSNSTEKSEDFHKLQFALNNGCLPTWLVDTKYSTYEGKDVIIGYGKDIKHKYVFYSDLTAKNINTGKTAVWKCDGIENLDIVGNPLPTDEEMHEGALYNDNGDIVANEYELEESNRRIRREKKQEKKIRDEEARKNRQWETPDNDNNSYSSNEECGYCSKDSRFLFWGGHGWKEVYEQKTGWVKCEACDGYGQNWNYNSTERRGESKACYVSLCNNGWLECRCN